AADHVRDEVVPAERDDAAGGLVIQITLQLGAKVRDLRQQRFRGPVPSVPLREQCCGGGKMLVFERLDFDPGHRGGTIALASMPKTLTGEELQLDDAPARDSELFLVDGNNLAYRAFFALPEELAPSEGLSANALLVFTNMLFKLLADYRPKGVAVAWDTRPVHRHELLD